MTAEIHLIPDSSAAWQFFIFMIVLIGLSFLVFRPIKRILLARRAKSLLLIEGSRSIEERIMAVSTEYLSKMEAAKASAMTEKESIRRAGMSEEHDIMEAARMETQAAIDKARKEIEASAEQALNELKNKIPAIAEKIAAKVKQ